MRLRIAEAGDERLLARLCAPVKELHVGARPDVFRGIGVAALEQWFRGVLAEGSARIWICHVGDEPAGYVLVRDERRPENAFCHPRHWHEVDQIGVDPRFQRRGIARALLQCVTESAAAEGVAEVELNCWSSNASARAAFAKLGFREMRARLVRRSDGVLGSDRSLGRRNET